ncbi:hypothetical protein LEMA_P014040.1 [Plenodomus lingam JN3]|uniref:ATP-dependent DNA ligase family profile domain-containing protein n=1 Tax=Leptosphaeria maculans (strain JN3 / isolate v23.1.3 / race Av1-4-5-6-7-8) TaxID=985895 RepID=E5A9D3_LEPMJ|nr:hypothetical protein LEMA_P014040.1 [Plenodomus lingam JN3]CBY00274.1 hypothetical protein LEMA_P014040.1 [Plenodomus lingam JN3]
MTVTFGAICGLLQSIEKITSQRPQPRPRQIAESKRQIIRNWFENQRDSLDDPGTDGGAVLSVIFPHRRKDRVYGIGPPRLAKKLIRLLRLNHNQKAIFDGWNSGTLGDLGVYAEKALQSRDGTFQAKPIIPIEHIDRLLGQLAAKSRFSDALIRKKGNGETNTDAELNNILIRLDSWEVKWLVRLILRDYCTIDIDEEFVFQQYHFLLPDLLNFQNDFDAVSGMLRGELSGYPAHPNHTREHEMRIEAAKKLCAVVGIKVGRPTFHKAWSFNNCIKLVGNRAWAAEVKYDGEYCEIHIDLENVSNKIKIFSKNGKDATADRRALHSPILEALRICQPDCRFKKQCILLGEMVLYSDREKKIMPFSKIRKHISRSGSFIGTLQDSLPHEWEHLMIVFFDVLKVDDKEVLRHCLQDRRLILRDLVRITPGRAMRSEWTLLDFKTGDGITDLKQAFARTLAERQEGLILKPLHAPYFPLLSEQGYAKSSFFIKLKKDYLSDMGGERDLGDFAVIGASYDAQIAPKSNIKPLHWTHFHLGCCTNLGDVQRSGARSKFKVVASLSLDKCIPKPDVKYLNIQGYVRQSALRADGSTKEFDIEQSPFVVEVLGGGLEKLQNEKFEMLRHPRIKKIHQDRTWRDSVTLKQLEQMAEDKWEIPDADQLDGHAKHVALLAKRYMKQAHPSQISIATDNSSQTSQQTTQRSSQETPVHIATDAIVPETQEQTCASYSSTQWSIDGSTQGLGLRASHETRLLIPQDPAEHLPTAPSPTPNPPARMKPSTHTAGRVRIPPSSRKRNSSSTSAISPPKPKRSRVLSPLHDVRSKQNLGSFGFDAEEQVIHVYAKEGVSVFVHAADGAGGDEC